MGSAVVREPGEGAVKRTKYASSVLVICLLCGVVMWSGGSLHAQSSRGGIESILDDHVRTVQEWEAKARTLIVLTITVGMLGVVSGALQFPGSVWCKYLTTAMGLTISLITVFNNTYYEVDHRTFRSRAAEARKFIDEVRLLLVQEPPATSNEDRKAWMNEITRRFQLLSDLEAKVPMKQASRGMLPAAYAQTSGNGAAPPWVTRLPTDEKNLYFLGTGESTSLASAKEYSRADAVERAADYLSHLLGKAIDPKKVTLDLEALGRDVAKVGEMVDTHFIYDAQAKSYRYYTLLRISRSVAQVDVSLQTSREGVSIPEALSGAIRNAQPATDAYYQRRSAVYSDAIARAHDMLSKVDYEAFMRGRQNRKEGKFREAASMLEEVARKYPDFFLGWYNLALAYDDLSERDKALWAYQRATRLEASQPTRDASFYNSYGFFLYRSGRKDEAAAQLKRALEIDPEHPKARRTLQTMGVR